MEKVVDVAPVPRILTGHAGPPPGQGPFISVKLSILGDLITSAAYETYQCPGCHACGEVLCELAKGKTVTSAREITRSTIAERVGPLPRHRQLCYGLAALALHDALKHV